MSVLCGHAFAFADGNTSEAGTEQHLPPDFDAEVSNRGGTNSNPACRR